MSTLVNKFLSIKSLIIYILFIINYLSYSHCYQFQRFLINPINNKLLQNHNLYSSKDNSNNLVERKELWKTISSLEKEAVELLLSGDDNKKLEAYKALSNSVMLKNTDPFLKLALAYSEALKSNNNDECERLLKEMNSVGLPPHLNNLIQQKEKSTSLAGSEFLIEEVDPGTTFSDTITEKIRVKVNSFFDNEKSDPLNGKYMFWYKVAIYNEGPEPVQIVARMWEIEKCRGEKEIVRGSGIMSTQPIIPPGDVFTYQSVCPLKVFPPKGKRIIGNMSGAYTMCKGNMGQHNFTVKVGKFNLILPESVATATVSK